MLVALRNQQRVEALIATKGFEYDCPSCEREVTLKQGRIVIPHFAHKPHTICIAANGETRAHLKVKHITKDSLEARGLKAEVEFRVETLPGDRRADVLVWSPSGDRIAIEFQHCSIGIGEIEARSFAYARAGIAQIWIPFLRSYFWKHAEHHPPESFVGKYAPRPFEKWIHGLNRKHEMWVYDPCSESFWQASIQGWSQYVEEKCWYNEGGDEMYAGGYYRHSKRYRTLSLKGPYKIDKLLMRIWTRRAFWTDRYRWPKGRVVSFFPMEN